MTWHLADMAALPGKDPADTGAATFYAPPRGAPPPPVADPDADKSDWGQEIWPTAAVRVPPGHLAVRLCNGTATSAGYHAPGDITVLPDAEARELLRQGLAREVRAV